MDAFTTSHIALAAPATRALFLSTVKPGSKAYVAGNAAYDTMIHALERGCWATGESRSTRAALGKMGSKTAYARLMALPAGKMPPKHHWKDEDEACQWTLEDEFAWDNARHELVNGWFHLREGRFGALPALLDRAGMTTVQIEACMAVLTARQNVAHALNLLDAAMPKPAIIMPGEVSPLVRGTLNAMKATAVKPCPTRMEQRQGTDKAGKTFFYWVCLLEWPAGTRHGTSGRGYAGCNCEACGHAIHNGANWVPLVLETADGPRSLWAGRDCATRLFGCKVVGEFKYEGEGARG